MSLSPEDRSFLKQIYRNLEDRPLQPDNPLYEPVYEQPGCEDPVELLHRCIDYSEGESLQMFSGFRGSGKTTELFRLKKRLEEQHYTVLYGDALDYINPSETIDISDLLIVLAGAFSDALEKAGVSIGEEAFWNRIWNYLATTEVELKEFGFKPELMSPIKTGLDLKLALKTTPTFRQELQKFLSGRLGELRNRVHGFIEEGVKAVRQAAGNDARIVFLFDSLEQIRGSLSNEKEVIASVERLFSSHLRMLELPYVHVVYTVPPWLQFVLPGQNVTVLPSVRQWNNDDERTEYHEGTSALRRLVRRRFGAQGLQRFLGDDPDAGRWPNADLPIRLCGGHFRDLLLLMRETVLRARSLPVSREVIESAIQSVRANFLPIAVEDARWLARIGETRTTGLQTTNPEEVARLTRFLDTHFVLYLTNGKEWYDIHPLIREEVADIVLKNPGAPPAPVS